jgi:7-cyano-7-deazaguanine synthase
VLDFYTYGKVVMAAPFVDWNKVDIAIYCVTEGLPMDLTYSCELGLDQPCGRCKSCIDLMTLEGTAPGS